MSDYEDYADALGQLRRFLNDVYMHKRIHSGLGYLTPVEFEEPWQREHEQPPEASQRTAPKVSSFRGALHVL